MLGTQQIGNTVDTNKVKSSVDTEIDRILSLLEEGQSKVVDGVITLDEIPINAGFCQGDCKVQYLGETCGLVSGFQIVSPIDDEFGKEFLSLNGTSHVLKVGKCVVYKPFTPHPLVSYLVYSPEGVELQHDEHAWVYLRPTGFYLFRHDRSGAIDPSAIEQQLRPAVD